MNTSSMVCIGLYISGMTFKGYINLPAGEIAMELIKRVAGSLIETERKRLFKWLYTLMTPSEHVSLLDIGGPSPGFEETAERFDRVIVLNQEPLGWYRKRVKNVEIIQADVCRLPFRDSSFDYIFSNATLEHISQVDWPVVSHEVVRVAARGFFIVTPNYWFPFEPHYLLPFFQWVPESVKHFLLFRLCVRIGFMDRANYHVINLPSRRQLEQLFQDANVDGWSAFFPRHLVVWKKF